MSIRWFPFITLPFWPLTYVTIWMCQQTKIDVTIIPWKSGRKFMMTDWKGRRDYSLLRVSAGFSCVAFKVK
jgi:hypothetical protein